MSVHCHGLVSRHPSVCRRRTSHVKLSSPYPELADSPRATVHAKTLPTELLLIIFSFVFDDLATLCVDSHEAHKECAVCNSPANNGQKHVVWEWQDDVLSHALFPYSLAAVCRRWRDIMASVPQFWTRLIIFLDGPLVDFRSHLKWSGKLPIEVYVLRRRHNTSLGIDKSEQARSKRVFEAIKPHLHRCHILRFSLLQSTSLPLLLFDFAGVNAPLLTDLRLECEIDDQRDCPDVCVPPHGSLHSSMQFQCPALTAVSLNGRNFRDLSLVVRHGYDFWLPVLQHIEKFTVAHYTAGIHQTYEITLYNLLQVIRRECMPRLTFLKLVDLDIRLTNTKTVPTLVDVTALNIHLEELDSEVIRQFCASIDVVHDLESFHVIRSSIPEGWDIPDTCDLVLEEVNDLCGINSPVMEWIGNRLVFTGCNGFNDEFLRMLRSCGRVPFRMYGSCGDGDGDGGGGGGGDDDDGSYNALVETTTAPAATSFVFNCSNLQEIYLNDCINYSIAELKKVIAARNAGLVPLGRRATESDGPPCILELYVTGIGPELSLEDKAWFEQRLPIFYWETRPREVGSGDFDGQLLV